MSEYKKEYQIKWLNINPINQSIEALYGVNAVLDSGESASLPNFKLVLDGDKYNQLFSLPVQALGQQTTFGQLLSYLTACGGKVLNPEFPVSQPELELFGNVGIEMLKGQEDESK